MAKRILFVDDEPMVLQGLQRSLRAMRNDWEMEFVNGGPQALESIGRQFFDIVVTDMRMPGMSGVELLEEVKKRSPQSLRMVLSGQSDRESIALRQSGAPISVEAMRRRRIEIATAAGVRHPRLAAKLEAEGSRIKAGFAAQSAHSVPAIDRGVALG